MPNFIGVRHLQGVKAWLFGLFIRCVPKNILSYFVGRVVNWHLPRPFGRWSVRLFARGFQLDMSEAERPLDSYQTIGELFTRRLQPQVRPVGAGFVHPVDGSLTVVGRVFSGELIQAKGKKYSLARFLHRDDETLKPFEGGSFLTYYLCPRDYHRVHSPVSGQIIGCDHVPGRLWPVNPWAVEHVSQLFAVNERLVIWIETTNGLLALVMVGATNVGKITLAFDDKIVTNQGNWKSVLSKKYRAPISIEKGQELGLFNMGSSVIVIAPAGYFDQLPPPGPYQVCYGQSLSQLIPGPGWTAKPLNPHRFQ